MMLSSCSEFVGTQHSAETALFDNTLSCDLCVPAGFVPGAGDGRPEHAQSLLHSLALIEERGFVEGPGEHDEPPLYRQRMDAKLDLNLLLLGRLLEQAITPLNVRQVSWSIRGARIEDPDAAGGLVGMSGVLKIQPCDWLPEVVELPARVMAVEAGRWIWLCFPVFSPQLNDTLEQYLFRQHRRQIARSRSASGGR